MSKLIAGLAIAATLAGAAVAHSGVLDRLFGQKSIPYSEFRPGYEEKFLPKGCKTYKSQKAVADINDDGRPDYLYWCDIYNPTFSVYADVLGGAVSGPDSYEGVNVVVREGKASKDDTFCSEVAIRRKGADNFLLYDSAVRERYVFSDADRAKRKDADKFSFYRYVEPLHLLTCEGTSCQAADIDRVIYINTLALNDDAKALEDGWGVDAFWRNDIIKAVHQAKPPSFIPYLFQEFALHTGGARALGGYRGILKPQQVASLCQTSDCRYPSGIIGSQDGDVFDAVSNLATDDSDNRFVADYLRGIVLDRSHSTNDAHRCGNKKSALKVLASRPDQYARSAVRSLAFAPESSLPGCVLQQARELREQILSHER